MPIDIEPYRPDRTDAVHAFNERLKGGGSAFRFPEQSTPSWLPKTDGESIYEEYFLAVQGSEVRGGYILKHQPFWLAGGVVPIGSLYLPLSEGTVNPQYGSIGAQLLLNALKKQPLLYSLGMGGVSNPYPKMLRAAGWRLCALPFHFLVLNPSAFCKNISILRDRTLVRVGLDVLAATGVGRVAIPAVHAFRRRPKHTARQVQAHQAREFSSWADLVWNAGRHAYALAAVRDRVGLERLYPATNERYLRLMITLDDTVIGWAVALDTPMTNHKHFGNMRVGSIIDCFAVPGRESEVIRGATEFLARREVDLIISNQSHRHWGAALDRAGFLRAPSNFIFAASPQLSGKIVPWESRHDLIHFTRGDGEGPTHL